MQLQSKELAKVGAYVKAHLGEWLSEHNREKSLTQYEMEIRERIVRVEEELKYQRELMRQGFDTMEKRFEYLTKRINRFMIWSFGITASATGIIIAVLR